MRLTRTGERTLSVRPELGFVPGRDRHDPEAPILHEVYVNQILDRTFRGRDFPVQPGQQFDWPGLSAVVAKVDVASPRPSPGPLLRLSGDDQRGVAAGA